jgi:CheY-like chemotaxis protein/anti-sigma regulatory factor (Ser/Thr protein kinase)
MTSNPEIAADVPAPAPVTVLVVDDSAVDRRLAGGILERHGNCRPIYANNGREALAIMDHELPSVVLTDLLMPEMDGLELVEAVRHRCPQVPVILMTAHGSEDVAFKALQSGAASYVPKRSLAADLLEALEQVLAAAQAGRHQQRLHDCLHTLESNYVLHNERALLPALVAQLQEDLARLRLCDPAGRIRVGIALEEALVNAMYHGNLEVSSELRQEDDRAYQLLAQQRLQNVPYRDRRLHVHARLTQHEATFTVRDEGPGFDPRTVPDPTDPDNLGRSSGRGLLLMQTFMDEVRFNDRGNQVTMVKRRAAAGH